jgi:sporulation and spore germination protein
LTSNIRPRSLLKTSMRSVSLRVLLIACIFGLSSKPLKPAAAMVPQTKALKLFFILLEDKGRLGRRIGCDDSVVPVVVAIEPTSTPLRAAFEHLLALHDETYCDTGMRNALYQSSLKVESVSIAGHTATIKLTGTYVVGGECDTPRAKAQFEETARQFPNVTKVKIYVNGKLETFDPT